jgi:hypothetical protein
MLVFITIDRLRSIIIYLVLFSDNSLYSSDTKEGIFFSLKYDDNLYCVL